MGFLARLNPDHVAPGLFGSRIQAGTQSLALPARQRAAYTEPRKGCRMAMVKGRTPEAERSCRRVCCSGHNNAAKADGGCRYSPRSKDQGT